MCANICRGLNVYSLYLKWKALVTDKALRLFLDSMYIIFFLHDFPRSEKNINQTNDAYLSNNQGLYRNLLQHNMRQRNSYNSWVSVCVLHWQVCYGLLRFWQIVIILIVVFLERHIMCHVYWGRTEHMYNHLSLCVSWAGVADVNVEC